MVIPGSIDRIDMGERDSEKFYCVYEVEEDLLEFRKIDCRPMIKRTLKCLTKWKKSPNTY